MEGQTHSNVYSTLQNFLDPSCFDQSISQLSQPISFEDKNTISFVFHSNEFDGDVAQSLGLLRHSSRIMACILMQLSMDLRDYPNIGYKIYYVAFPSKGHKKVLESNPDTVGCVVFIISIPNEEFCPCPFFPILTNESMERNEQSQNGGHGDPSGEAEDDEEPSKKKRRKFNAPLNPGTEKSFVFRPSSPLHILMCRLKLASYYFNILAKKHIADDATLIGKVVSGMSTKQMSLVFGSQMNHPKIKPSVEDFISDSPLIQDFDHAKYCMINTEQISPVFDILMQKFSIPEHWQYKVDSSTSATDASARVIPITSAMFDCQWSLAKLLSVPMSFYLVASRGSLHPEFAENFDTVLQTVTVTREVNDFKRAASVESRLEFKSLESMKNIPKDAILTLRCDNLKAMGAKCYYMTADEVYSQRKCLLPHISLPLTGEMRESRIYLDSMKGNFGVLPDSKVSEFDRNRIEAYFRRTVKPVFFFSPDQLGVPDLCNSILFELKRYLGTLREKLCDTGKKFPSSAKKFNFMSSLMHKKRSEMVKSLWEVFLNGKCNPDAVIESAAFSRWYMDKNGQSMVFNPPNGKWTMFTDMPWGFQFTLNLILLLEKAGVISSASIVAYMVSQLGPSVLDGALSLHFILYGPAATSKTFAQTLAWMLISRYYSNNNTSEKMSADKDPGQSAAGTAYSSLLADTQIRLGDKSAICLCKNPDGIEFRIPFDKVSKEEVVEIVTHSNYMRAKFVEELDMSPFFSEADVAEASAASKNDRKKGSSNASVEIAHSIVKRTPSAISNSMMKNWLTSNQTVVERGGNKQTGSSAIGLNTIKLIFKGNINFMGVTNINLGSLMELLGAMRSRIQPIDMLEVNSGLNEDDMKKIQLSGSNTDFSDARVYSKLYITLSSFVCMCINAGILPKINTSIASDYALRFIQDMRKAEVTNQYVSMRDLRSIIHAAAVATIQRVVSSLWMSPLSPFIKWVDGKPTFKPFEPEDVFQCARHLIIREEEICFAFAMKLSSMVKHKIPVFGTIHQSLVVDAIYNFCTKSASDRVVSNNAVAYDKIFLWHKSIFEGCKNHGNRRVDYNEADSKNRLILGKGKIAQEFKFDGSNSLRFLKTKSDFCSFTMTHQPHLHEISQDGTSYVTIYTNDSRVRNPDDSKSPAQRAVENFAQTLYNHQNTIFEKNRMDVHKIGASLMSMFDVNIEGTSVPGYCWDYIIDERKVREFVDAKIKISKKESQAPKSKKKEKATSSARPEEKVTETKTYLESDFEPISEMHAMKDVFADILDCEFDDMVDVVPRGDTPINLENEEKETEDETRIFIEGIKSFVFSTRKSGNRSGASILMPVLRYDANDGKLQIMAQSLDGRHSNDTFLQSWIKKNARTQGDVMVPISIMNLSDDPNRHPHNMDCVDPENDESDDSFDLFNPFYTRNGGESSFSKRSAEEEKDNSRFEAIYRKIDESQGSNTITGSSDRVNVVTFIHELSSFIPFTWSPKETLQLNYQHLLSKLPPGARSYVNEVSYKEYRGRFKKQRAEGRSVYNF